MTVASSSVLAFTSKLRVRRSHWSFRGCRVHSELIGIALMLRPASWLALLSRTFTSELSPIGSPQISVEYDYVGKQSIPTTGLSPASPTALWAAEPGLTPGTLCRDFLVSAGNIRRQSFVDPPSVAQRIPNGHFNGPECVEAAHREGRLPNCAEGLGRAATIGRGVKHPLNSRAGHRLGRRGSVHPLTRAKAHRSQTPVVKTIGLEIRMSRPSVLR